MKLFFSFFATLLLFCSVLFCSILLPPKIDVLAFTTPLARHQVLTTGKINGAFFSYSPVKDVLCFIGVGKIRLLIRGLFHLSDALFKSSAQSFSVYHDHHVGFAQQQVATLRVCCIFKMNGIRKAKSLLTFDLVHLTE